MPTDAWKQTNSIGNVLVRQGVMTAKQLDLVVEEQVKRKTKAGDSGEIVLFGRLAVELGFATDVQIQAALDEQKAIMAPPCNEDAVDDALNTMDRAVARARQTSARFTAVSFAGLHSIADKA